VVGGNAGLVVISVASLVIQNRTQRLLLANEVEESRVACVACELEGAVAFLAPVEYTEALVDQIALRFNSKSLALGVSMPVSGFDRLQSAYRQAVFARDYSPSAGIRHCRDLALPFLIGALQKESVARDLLHPALGMLESYDVENGTDLLETLRTYVETGCSQSETAQKLYVHLNTLKYRLKRIGDLTGIDYKDRESMFYIELSLRLDPR
jgi:sugar diacid utilization regulator